MPCDMRWRLAPAPTWIRVHAMQARRLRVSCRPALRFQLPCCSDRPDHFGWGSGLERGPPFDSSNAQHDRYDLAPRRLDLPKLIDTQEIRIDVVQFLLAFVIRPYNLAPLPVSFRPRLF